MSFSGLFIRGLLDELGPILIQSKIDKIYNYQNEMHFWLRTTQGKQVLVVSLDPRHYRLQLLAAKPEITYPEKPNNFCQLLRRHLPGLPLVELSQPGLERLIVLTFAAGYCPDLRPRHFRLVCELMGKYSNLLLLDADNFILGAARHSSGERNALREVVPGAEYQPPPTQSRHDLFSIDSPYFRRSLLLAPSNEPLVQVLLRTVQGLDKLLAQEILHRAGLDPQLTRAELKDYQLSPLWQQVAALQRIALSKQWAPCLVVDAAGKPTDFSPVALTHGNAQAVASFTVLQETFYQDIYQKQEAGIQKAELQEALTREIKKVKRKAAAQQQDFASAEEALDYKEKADLLLTYQHQIKPGQTSVTLPRFSDNRPVEISLDPAVGAVTNAERYYARYAKAKRKRERSQQELAKTIEYLRYLEQLQEDLRQLEDSSDLLTISDELASLGVIKAKTKPSPKRAGSAHQAPQYQSIRLDDGTEILVGRNSKQNDLITMTKAKPDDLWFHVKNRPGSHVILRTRPGEPPSEEAILYAARLAATYSSAYQSSKVEVDYTERKNVWKPKGAKPGMVLYENYRTLIVQPLDPAAIT